MSPALARRLPLSTLLIGVDVGATEVKAHEVLVVERGSDPALRLGARRSTALLPRVPGFLTPCERGLTLPADLGPIEPAEREQAWCWIETSAKCIAEVARRRAATSVLVGIAAPGLKAPDGRGIEFALNGPRVPDFVEHLQERLVGDGLELAGPIARLESDGTCCGLGEDWAEEGLFRGVDDAYYIGGGTGLAEALKLGGTPVRIDGIEDWFPRAWRLTDATQESYERVLSVSGINRQWTERSGFELPLERGRYPEERARTDERARALFMLTGARLASLIAERILALWMRTQDEGVLPGPHVLQRIVVGQRLGDLLEDARTRASFRHTLERDLTLHLDRLGLEERYPPDDLGGIGRTLLVRRSTLRAAPAIGAAAAALVEWSQRV